MARNNNNNNSNKNGEQEQNTDKKTKLEVLIPFTDKNTNEHYIAGDKIEVDKERADELLKDQRKLVKLASK